MGENREWVIVCNRHNYQLAEHCLLFWGEKTEDIQKRSYGGYTSNLDGCERYTKDELMENGYHFPFYESESDRNIFRRGDFCIKISDLDKLGRKMTVIYK